MKQDIFDMLRRYLLCGAVLLALVALSGCTTLSKVGRGVCAAETQLSASIKDVGELFGVPGKVPADLTTGILHGFCQVFKSVMEAPQDACDQAVELFNGKPDGPPTH